MFKAEQPVPELHLSGYIIIADSPNLVCLNIWVGGGGDGCGGLINMCFLYGLTQIYNTSGHLCLWSRLMVWFGLHLRPFDPLCILNPIR